MKKLTRLLAALLCLCVFTPLAMADDAGTEEASLLTRVLEIAEDGDDLIEMYAEDLSELMGIEPEEYVDFVYLAGTSVETGREVIAVLAVDEVAANHVEEMLNTYLEGRIRETRNYFPVAFKLLSEAKVAREGLLVVLAIGEQAEQETKLLLTGE